MPQASTTATERARPPFLPVSRKQKTAEWLTTTILFAIMLLIGLFCFS